MTIADAEPGEARTLFLEYADALGVDLSYQDFERELAELPGEYARPAGRLLVARLGDETVGCVALRPVGDCACEMKRLFVLPGHRGIGAGRALAEAVIAAARDERYTAMRLDTLPQMQAAQAMYETLGFREIEPYYASPVPGTRFLELDLGDPGTITLRPLRDSDLDALFEWERDPRAVRMAAFTRADPSDRRAFDAHYERVRGNPSNTLLAIDADGEFVGTIGSYPMDGERNVTYWTSPARWGQGIASRALRAFLETETTRPLYGRVAEHNAGSAKVLLRAGFVEVGSETAFAPGVGAEVVERTYRLSQ